MEQQQEETKSNGKNKPKGRGKNGAGRQKAQGRKDESKVAAVTQPKVISERLDELVQLHINAKQAAEAAAEAVTKAAEDSGYLASSVKKLVVAKAGDKFEEKHREVEQQAELFDEVS